MYVSKMRFHHLAFNLHNPLCAAKAGIRSFRRLATVTPLSFGAVDTELLTQQFYESCHRFSQALKDYYTNDAVKISDEWITRGLNRINPDETDVCSRDDQLETAILLLEWFSSEVRASTLRRHHVDNFQEFPFMIIHDLFMRSAVLMDFPEVVLDIALELEHSIGHGAPLKRPGSGLTLEEEQELFDFVMERLISKLGLIKHSEKITARIGEYDLEAQQYWDGIYFWLEGRTVPSTLPPKHEEPVNLCLRDVRRILYSCGYIPNHQLFNVHAMPDGGGILPRQNFNQKALAAIMGMRLLLDCDLKLSYMCFRLLDSNDLILSILEEKLCAEIGYTRGYHLLDDQLYLSVARVMNELRLKEFEYRDQSEVRAVVQRYVDTLNDLIAQIIIDRASKLTGAKINRADYYLLMASACNSCRLHRAAFRLLDHSKGDWMTCFTDPKAQTPEMPSARNSRRGKAWKAFFTWLDFKYHLDEYQVLVGSEVFFNYEPEGL